MSRLLEKKITLGRDAEGKRIRKSVYARTKAELERKVFEARQDYYAISKTPAADITLIAYARRWLSTTKGKLAINTRAMYEVVVERHLAPELSDLYFHEIRQTDLQELINKRWDHPATCGKIRITLKQIYDSAAEEDIQIPKGVNVGKLTMPPKRRSTRRALTPEEERAIFDADLEDKERAFLFILYYCGLRREEVLALQAHQIDFQRLFVRVDKSIVFDKNTAVLSRTKTQASVRDVPLPDAAVEFLNTYCADKTILFPMDRAADRYMSLSSFMRFWRGIQKRLSAVAPSAAELTPHYFRHNYATKLYYSGISPKKAAELLGHANTDMIMKIYAHLDEAQERTSEKLNMIFK